MKSVDASAFAANLDSYLGESPGETILVTRDGKPYAVVRGLDYDAEQLDLAESADFWAMIARRRDGKMIAWDDVKAALDE